ncbi:11202_t:CDS:1 [Cetraspora pellucida]|uniref:11202_t:CDS:1 n=1 Tax=Cetraspora pellucida TaxID=1433469 RepID=A0ACA9KNX8_9GLOM|nr:11202_t:CDS:1 [Cetraspora pellucida]
MANANEKFTEGPSSQEISFVHVDPSSSPNLTLTDLENLLKKLYEKVRHKLTLTSEELLAPRKQRKISKPPRAQNEFIMFRKEYISRERKKDPNRIKSMKARELSKEASVAWKTESAEFPAMGQFFKILSDVAIERHRKAYPGYIYEPDKKKDKHKDEPEGWFKEYIDINQCA